MKIDFSTLCYNGFDRVAADLEDWFNTPTKKMIDLFCGEGGATKGYQYAGFEVLGIDKNKYSMKYYIGDHSIQMNVFDVPLWFIKKFDCIHASPPCQEFSNLKYITGHSYIDLIEPTRDLLRESELPYVIENVPKAPLIDPIMLCGGMFNLRLERDWLRRHRIFETNWSITAPQHEQHWGGSIIVAGNGSSGGIMKYRSANADEARALMQMPWASRNGCTQAIPPAYTRYIGERLIDICP